MGDCIVQYRDDMMTGGKKTMTMTTAARLDIWSRLPGWRSRPEISGVHFVKPGWCSQPWSHMGLLSITMDGSGQTDQIPDITPLVSGLMISPVLYTGLLELLRWQSNLCPGRPDYWIRWMFGGSELGSILVTKTQWSSCIFRSGYNCEEEEEEEGRRRGGLLTPYIIPSLPDLITHNFNV